MTNPPIDSLFLRHHLSISFSLQVTKHVWHNLAMCIQR